MSLEELDGAALRELVLRETRGLVIDFWSPWCAPCRALRPHLARMAESHAQWRFVAVNTESHPEVAREFSVSSLPCLLWYHDRREVGRLEGAVLVSSVAAKLDELRRPQA